MRTFLPAPRKFDAEALARAMAPAIELAVNDEDIADIVLNLERIAGFAALLGRVPGIDAADSAPVFHAKDWRET